MNEFVEECRREWKRLGVPDPVANEMAVDLAADLEEAEADGVSAEEVLGSGAFDPRSFATAWAAERGVIQRTSPNGHGVPRRSLMVAAIGVFALIAVSGGVLAIVASPSGPTRLELAAPVGPEVPTGPAVFRLPAPPPGVLSVAVDGESLPAGLVYTLPLPPATRIVAVDSNDSGVDTRAVGWVLLAVGLAGVVPLTMLSLWVGPDRWPRRRTTDDRPSGPAY